MKSALVVMRNEIDFGVYLRKLHEEGFRVSRTYGYRQTCEQLRRFRDDLYLIEANFGLRSRDGDEEELENIVKLHSALPQKAKMAVLCRTDERATALREKGIEAIDYNNHEGILDFIHSTFKMPTAEELYEYADRVLKRRDEESRELQEEVRELLELEWESKR